MTTKTRYFVIVSLLVAGRRVGHRAGGVLRRVSRERRPRIPAVPRSFSSFPRDATVIAARQRSGSDGVGAAAEGPRARVPRQENGQRELQEQTGINIETDIDRVVACLHPDPDDKNMPGAGMVLARGRFDETKIEALMREHGAQVEAYKGKRLIVADVADAARREIEKRQGSRRAGARRRWAVDRQTGEGELRARVSRARARGARQHDADSLGDRSPAGRRECADRAAERHRQRRADESGPIARQHRQCVGGGPLRRARVAGQAAAECGQPAAGHHVVFGGRSRRRRHHAA